MSAANETGQSPANRKRKAPQQNQAGIKMYSNRWMQKVYEEKPPFPDELFETMFTPEKIETLVAALKLATEKEVEESSRLLESDYTYSVLINSHKVPHVPVHLSRITLKHTLQNEDSEIALFVKDLKRGRRLDFEPTIQHYENLLREKNVTKYRITVIPVNQLYNEYATFELRRKLSYLYDKFLVDSSIAAHVNGFLGSKMLKKGRLAFPVDLSKENLSAEIDKALRKVFYKHVNQGITQNVQVGRHSMPNDQIAENIIDLLRQFGNVHPGGYKNVHKLYLRPQANVSVVIPLYVSADKPIDGAVVDQTGGEKALQQQSKTASQLLADFDINAAGKLVQKRRPAAQIIDDELLLSEDEEEKQTATKKANESSAAEKTTEKSESRQSDKPQQADKNQQLPLAQRRKRARVAPVSNNRPPAKNNLDQLLNQSRGDDLFVRQRNFSDSDNIFDRPNRNNINDQFDNERSFTSNFGNEIRNFGNGRNSFGNDRNFGGGNDRSFGNNNSGNNSNNFRNDREFGSGEESIFNRRPNKNNNFGGNDNNTFSGGRMFNNRF